MLLSEKYCAVAGTPSEAVEPKAKLSNIIILPINILLDGHFIIMMRKPFCKGIIYLDVIFGCRV